MTVPLWARGLAAVDRAAWYAYRAQEVVRDELLRAFLTAKQREEMTTLAYEKQTTYLPGGERFETGLFPWEAAVLDDPAFPRGGRVLLTAAGGGRELAALLERGWDVVAFEPNDVLRAGCEAVARSHPGSRVLAGTYADMIRAATTGGGPLDALRGLGPFDATILGWGSLTHVTDPDEQAAVLAAARALSPEAPLLVSFFLRKDTPRAGRADALRRRVRSALHRVGGQTPPEGLAYEMNGGFVYWFTDLEIHALALRAGYEVRSLSPLPFPHAVLAPMTASGPLSAG